MATDTDRLIVTWEARLRDFERQMARGQNVARTSFRRMEQEAQRFETRFAAIGRGAAAAFTKGIGLLGVGIGVGALKNFVGQALNTAAAIQDLSDRTGISTDEVQKLTFAFTQSGAEAGTVAAALEAFGKRVGDAAAGGGELLKVLEDNGVALRDAQGNIRPLVDILGDFANVIKRAGSESEQLDLATAAFGRGGGADLVVALQNGKAGLDEMRQAAVDAGVILREDLVQSGAVAEDALAALGQAIRNKVNTAILATAQAIAAVKAEWQSLLGVRGLNIGEDALLRLRDFGAGNAPADYDPAGDMAAARGLGLDPNEVMRPGNPFTAAFAPPAPEASLSTALARQAAVRNPATAAGTGEGGPGFAARAERDAAEELITTLREELSLLNATEVEREVANNLRMAGADATDEQRAQIEALTRQMIAEQEAAENLAETWQEIGDAAGTALKGIISDLLAGKSASEAFGNALARIGDQLVNRGIDALIGSLIGGGGAGGFLGSLLGGSRAVGGPIEAGRAYRVHKDEWIVPRTPGTVVPVSGASHSPRVDGAVQVMVSFDHPMLRGVIVQTAGPVAAAVSRKQMSDAAEAQRRGLR